MKKTNTTTAQNTTATQEQTSTKAATRARKDSTKAAETTTTAISKPKETKNPVAMAEDKATAEKSALLWYNPEEGKKSIFQIPKIATDENGVAVILEGRGYVLPKNVKKGQEKPFILEVERATLDQIKARTATQIADLLEAIRKQEGVATHSQQSKLDNYNKLVELVNKTVDRLKLGTIVPGHMSTLVACDITGTPLNIEIGALKKALASHSAYMDGELAKYYGGESIQMSQAERENLILIKNKVREALAPFSAESALTVEFKLKPSNKDVLTWYKLGQNSWGAKTTCKWSDSTSKALERDLCKYFLHKVRAGEESDK